MSNDPPHRVGSGVAGLRTPCREARSRQPRPRPRRDAIDEVGVNRFSQLGRVAVQPGRVLIAAQDMCEVIGRITVEWPGDHPADRRHVARIDLHVLHPGHRQDRPVDRDKLATVAPTEWPITATPPAISGRCRNASRAQPASAVSSDRLAVR